MNRIEVQKFIKKSKILDVIIKNPGLSKTQIKIKADLSMESTLSYLDALEKDGLVVSKCQNRKGKPGRKAEAYFAVPDSSFYIGIKFLAHRINGVVLNLNGEVIKKYEKIFERRKINQDELMSRINDCVKELLECVDKNKAAAIGISCPGLVDSKNGILNHYTSVINKNVPLKRLLEEKYDIPVYLDSTTKTKAVYYTLKNSSNKKDIIFIYIGAGVSSAFISNGKVYRCDSNNDGEIGHLTVDGHHGMCSCGRKGCLETIIGNNYVINTLCQNGLNVTNIQEFVDALNNNNEVALAVISDITNSLGSVLSHILTFTAVDEIVISGLYVQAKEFKTGIMNYLKDNCLPELTKSLVINYVADENNLSAIEAATLAFDKTQNDFE